MGSRYLPVFLACGMQAAQKPKDADCLACHSDPTLTMDVNGKKVSLYVDPAEAAASIHGTMFTCVDCHGSSPCSHCADWRNI